MLKNYREKGSKKHPRLAVFFSIFRLPLEFFKNSNFDKSMVKSIGFLQETGNIKC